jgi:hypothetical protein
MKGEIMGTHATSNIPCALTRPLPPIPALTRWPVSSLSSRVRRNSALAVSDIYQIRPRITYVDRAIIRDYFHQHNLHELVRPAWMKALFPESHKQSLPEELECRLSVPFPGHERILVGSDVLLVETGSHTIVDVMRGIHAII